MAISTKINEIYEKTAFNVGVLTRVLSICRVGLFFNLLVAVYLIFAPQGLDSIINLINREEHAFPLLVMTIFFTAAFAWATMTWYWSRVLLEITLIDVNRLSESEIVRFEHCRLAHFLHRQVPRILGSLPLLLIGLAMLKVRATNTSNINAEQLNSLLTRYGIVFCLLSVILYLFYVYRRPVANWLYRHMQNSFLQNIAVVNSIIGALRVAEQPVHYKQDITRLIVMIKPALFLIGLSLVVSTIVFIIFAIKPAFAQNLSPVNVVLMSAPVWLPVAHMLLVLGYAFRFPVFVILFVCAVIFSSWNDNHVIRTLTNNDTVKVKNPDTRLTPAAQMEKWLAARGALNSEEPYPVFLVAAEGGGIRAAYWSAMLLAKLQELNNKFSQHVFALSGISGGSVGTGVYVNLLAQNKLPACTLAGFDAMGCHTHTILKQDYLSPVLSSLLYGDLAQRFLPVAVNTFDRARALESGFETSWERVVENNQLANNFLDTWNENGLPQRIDLPSLILTSTWVETGKRIAISNIRFPQADFPEMVDYFTNSPQPIRNSTAMHNSARFTFVSPAGTMKNDKGRVWGHLVDGGYHDNTGAMALLDLVQNLENKLGNKIFKRLRFHVLYIINNPQLQVTGGEIVNSTGKPLEFLTEIGAPVATLGSIRNSQQNFVRNQLTQYLRKHGGETYVLQARQNAPLGWTLSTEATDKLRKDILALQPKLNMITAAALK